MIWYYIMLYCISQAGQFWYWIINEVVCERLLHQIGYYESNKIELMNKLATYCVFRITHWPARCLTLPGHFTMKSCSVVRCSYFVATLTQMCFVNFVLISYNFVFCAPFQVFPILCKQWTVLLSQTCDIIKGTITVIALYVL